MDKVLVAVPALELSERHFFMFAPYLEHLCNVRLYLNGHRPAEGWPLGAAYA